MQAQHFTDAHESPTPNQKRSLDSVLLVGGEDAFKNDALNRILNEHRFQIMGQSKTLLEGLSRLEFETIDLVLLGGEFRREESSLFMFEAQRRGFAGLILHVASLPRETPRSNSEGIVNETLFDGSERNLANEERPASPAIAALVGDNSVQVGDFVLDVTNQRAWVRGVELQLSAREFKLLTAFCRHPQELLSYQDLAEALSNKRLIPRDYIRGLIRKVRKKIETTTRPRYILTQPCHGYRFVPSP